MELNHYYLETIVVDVLSGCVTGPATLLLVARSIVLIGAVNRIELNLSQANSARQFVHMHTN